jgi:hypothetical protein
LMTSSMERGSIGVSTCGATAVVASTPGLIS